MLLRKLLGSRGSQFIQRLWMAPANAAMPASRAPSIIPGDIPVEEERVPGYEPEQFYTVHPGDILHNRSRHPAVVMAAQPLCRTESHCRPNVEQDLNKHELNIDRRLKTNPSHNDFMFVRTMLDNFEVTGPEDKHTCLVYEALREPLGLFQQRWPDGKLPPGVVKVYMKFFLQGLNYLHSECHVIHTDLKLDNIMMRFEDPHVIEEFVENHVKNPMPPKVVDGQSIHLSHHYFERLKRISLVPMITDFGPAELGDGPELLRRPIQPPDYHAPEVILGTGWTYSADIWNLGLLIWNMMENKDLFAHIRSSQGAYDAPAHLAEMIALLGPPPKTLIDREKGWSEVKWGYSVPNAEGEFFQTVRECYGGPFFNSEGDFLYTSLIPNNTNLPDSVLSLER